MSNDDILNADTNTIENLPPEKAKWIYDHYTKISADSPDYTEKYGNLKWEYACREGVDWKYGRFKICREKMLKRSLTFDEFYGGGIVD